VGADSVQLAPSGELTERAARHLLHDVCRQAAGRPVVIDCAAVHPTDTVAVARLLHVIDAGRRDGRPVHIANPSDALRRSLGDLDADVLARPAPRARGRVLATIGREAVAAGEAAGRIIELMRNTIVALAVPAGRHGIKWGRTLEQVALIGVRASGIVIFISFLVGLVLALNGAIQLRQFGAAIYIANMVAISMAREMGPLITAIVVSGRSGSAIAAEIGTMVVSEELDAMRTMALNPVRYLVVPRILALVLAMPLLTVLSNAAGIFGGYLIGVLALDLPSQGYITQTAQSLFISDVLSGLVKSIVFALIIGFVGVYRGLTVHGGPAGVGLATTASVVTSINLCIVATAIITAVLYYAI